MYAIVVTFQINDGQMATFLPLMMQNAQASLKEEPECHQFDVCTDPARPNEVFLYELYADAAAFKAHLQSPHFMAFDQRVASLIASKDVRSFAQVHS